MLRLVTVFLWFACLATASTTSPTHPDWPAFRGPSQDSAAVDANRFEQGYGLVQAWKQPIGPGYSSVSISDGIAVTLYGGETRDFAVAFDAKTGKKQWSFDIGEAYKGNGGSYDGPLATPLIDGKLTYVLGPVGDLFALETKTGKKVFHVNLKELGGIEPYFGFTSSPLATDKALIVHVGGEKATAGLLGLDKKTGKKLWASPAFSNTYETGSLLTLFGKQQMVVASGLRLVGVDTDNGQELWSLETELRFGGHITPVTENTFFIQPGHYQDDSVMVEVSKENDAFQAKILWKTKEIGKVSGMAVHHEGYLYGYSGRFLTCIDVAEGKRQWKSRPPGAGFLIKVENQLAVMGRKGGLFLIEASPKGYQENASLEVFDDSDTPYNPPSYAGGKLYVRSMKEIAAVDVGRAERTEIADTGAGTLPNSKFAAKIAEIEKADNPKAVIDAFMAAQKSFPIIEGDRYVHFVYRGEAKDVALAAQSLGAYREFAMRQVGGTDLFYYSTEVDPAAHIMYAISTDFQEAAADPRNNKLTGHSMWDDDPVSLLAMPSFSDRNHLTEPAEGAVKGRIEEIELESKHTEKKRPLKVYLPNGYDKGDARYPTVYVDYGFMSLDKGLMANTLDHLIGKQIQPMIVVFIPPQPNKYAERRFAENSEKMAAMVAEEIVPHIDSTYRTRADRNARGLISHYMMAPISVYTALKYPQTFGKVAVQSGAMDPELHENILAGIKAGGEKPSFHLEWGHYDLRGDSRRPLIEWNKSFADTLKKKGFSVNTAELPMAQGWGNWRTRQDDILTWLFPLETN